METETQIPPETEKYEKVRETLMGSFNENISTLSQALHANKESAETVRTRPLVTVVVSLWEESEDELTAKVFERSVYSLLTQADQAGIDLDFVMVANNGGGKTPELGNKLVENIHNIFEGRGKFRDDPTSGIVEKKSAQVVEMSTARPDGEADPRTPWKFAKRINEDKPVEGNNRYFLVRQEYTEKPADVNAGKIRALRDVSAALYEEVTQNGYTPGAVFQMDAETILEYSKESLSQNEPIPPFKAMLNNLKRGGHVGVGSKDRLEILDRDTGLPIDVPRAATQEGTMLINQNLDFNMSGGAMLVRPGYYIAGMNAIAQTLPGIGTEDYLFSRMIEAQHPGEEGISPVRPMKIISHLNRYELGKDTIRQINRWKNQIDEIDKVFPETKYPTPSLLKNTLNVVVSRLRHFAREGKVEYLTQLVKDAKEVPEIVAMLKDDKGADLFEGSAVFTHDHH